MTSELEKRTQVLEALKGTTKKLHEQHGIGLEYAPAIAVLLREGLRSMTELAETLRDEWGIAIEHIPAMGTILHIGLNDVNELVDPSAPESRNEQVDQLLKLVTDAWAKERHAREMGGSN